MAQYYPTVAGYVAVARLQLQDLVAPYRYEDETLVRALNHGVREMSRIRPDILLDLKYQRPLRKGDTDDGMIAAFTVADLLTDVYLPVPSKYSNVLEWFVAGWVQFLDVTDTQDQRAQGFMAKFQSQLMTLSAA